MAETCTHLDQVKRVKPKTKGCEECLKMGDSWVHLRLCLSCGTSAAATPPKTSTPQSIFTPRNTHCPVAGTGRKLDVVLCR